MHDVVELQKSEHPTELAPYAAVIRDGPHGHARCTQKPTRGIRRRLAVLLPGWL